MSAGQPQRPADFEVARVDGLRIDRDLAVRGGARPPRPRASRTVRQERGDEFGAKLLPIGSPLLSTKRPRRRRSPRRPRRRPPCERGRSGAPGTRAARRRRLDVLARRDRHVRALERSLKMSLNDSLIVSVRTYVPGTSATPRKMASAGREGPQLAGCDPAQRDLGHATSFISSITSSALPATPSCTTRPSRSTMSRSA